MLPFLNWNLNPHIIVVGQPLKSSDHSIHVPFLRRGVSYDWDLSVWGFGGILNNTSTSSLVEEENSVIFWGKPRCLCQFPILSQMSTVMYNISRVELGFNSFNFLARHNWIYFGDKYDRIWKQRAASNGGRPPWRILKRPTYSRRWAIQDGCGRI